MAGCCGCTISAQSNWARRPTPPAHVAGSPGGRAGRHPAAGSNALSDGGEVRTRLAAIARNFPAGITAEIAYDPTRFVAESVHELAVTIGEAVFLVVLVVLLFLQNWRAATIPILAIPVSLIGTFGVMIAFGFTLNVLTLFGLVLAIGIVVDDAIVVVENVDAICAPRPPSSAPPPRPCWRSAGALSSIALVLCAVFVPTAFLEGSPAASSASSPSPSRSPPRCPASARSPSARRWRR